MGGFSLEGLFLFLFFLFAAQRLLLQKRLLHLIESC